MSAEERNGVTDKQNDSKKNANTNEDSESSTTESLTPGKYLAIPPDGGWGWVIVAASFLINGLVDGLAAIFGVFQPEFLKEFGASRGKTALAGSLMAGSFMISGPMVSGLVNAYGCRIVTIIGSFVAALSYVLATFSPNIDILILTYGVMAGVGVGMFYLPAMVMVSFYFERRRALATGIACSGAGFGMVVLAPVSAALLSAMSWQNSLYVIGGITLLASVLGLFMRPLKSLEITPETSESGAEPLIEKMPLDEQCDTIKPNSDTNDALLRNGDIHVDDTANGDINNGIKDDRPNGDVHDLISNEHISTIPNGIQKSSSQSKGSLNALKKSLSHHHSVSSAYSRCSSPFQYSKAGHDAKEDTTKSLHVTFGPCKNNKYSSTPVISSRLNCTEDCHHDTDNLNAEYHEKKFLRHRHASQSCHNLASQNPKCLVREKLIEEMNRPLNRLDIFYSSSILTAPEFRNNGESDLASVLEKITVIPEESLQEPSSTCCECIPRPTKNAMKQMLDLSIMMDPTFIVICLASAFIQVAYFIPVVFISEYAITFGINNGQAASLVSIIGGCNGIGRAFHGALANHPKVSVLHLNNWTLIVAGASTVICPILCYNYATLIAYCAIFGFFVAGFPPLANLLLVEYLGIAKLSNAFGLLSMVRGLATCAGAPIAGVLLESTKSFSVAFYFAGSLFVVAGLIHYLLPVAIKCQQKNRTQPMDEV